MTQILKQFILEICPTLILSCIQCVLNHILRLTCQILCIFNQHQVVHDLYNREEGSIYSIAPLSLSLGNSLKLNFPRKILVIDLDETLINSKYENSLEFSSFFIRDPDYTSWVSVDKQLVKFVVFKRPFVNIFLDIVSQWYDLIIYTASIEPYGNSVIDFLEKEKQYFKKRLFRQHCKFTLKGYHKNLLICSRDLANVAIIDNSPLCYHLFEENAIPISTWFYEESCDTALLDILPFLDALRFSSDMRHILKRRIPEC